MNKNNSNKIILAASVLLLMVAVAAVRMAGHEKKPLSQTEFMLDTVCTVTLYEWDGSGQALLEETFARCRQYEQMFSPSVSGSDIYRINHSGGHAVSVSEETALLISDALTFCERSQGKYDITIYPVKQLWNFSGTTETTVPDAQSVEDALKLVNYRQVVINGTDVTLPDGMAIDLGSIAKGYIADQLAAFLRSRQVKCAILDLGGNIYAIGHKPDGSPWRVGIQEPFGDGTIDTVAVSDASVVTSGVYQRFFRHNGTLYHHILDPASGMPCDTGLYSVTVTGRCSEECDALATVCMLTGYEGALPILKDYPDVTVIFVTSEKERLYVNA